MGFRLNIAKEAPTINNNNSYIFNDKFMISTGGAWELNIFKIFKENAETVNLTRKKCKTYPNCVMCDCSNDQWTKINIIDLQGKDEYLKYNSNIARCFIIEDIPEDDLQDNEYCNFDYIISKKHRDYIWINIS
jgi:hypothetical protein